MRKVVVVDESHTQVALYERSVSALNVGLTSFHSPDDAFVFLRANGADLLFLDLAMTGHDGLSWLRELREIPLHTETPVVVVTTKDYAQDRVLAKDLGAVDYLVKPLRSQEIREIICAYSDVQSKDNGSEPP
ncbi:MAG: response regulator [Chromatiales bacterium]|jgi:DNA-binding response OmpR family regulator|nr:response regulator [Chromatiales bacterium]